MPRSLSILASSLLLACSACAASSSLGSFSAALPGTEQSMASHAAPALNEIHWKPQFLALRGPSSQTVQLLYAPASLEFKISNDCAPASVQFARTGSGHKHGQQYIEFSVAALSQDAYRCYVYATAPHAQIRATLQVSIKHTR